MEDFPPSGVEFWVGQRVHASGDTRRIGTVKYVGPVEGHSGTWVGVDWDNGDGKHDGSIKGIRYFHARSERSGSFVRPQNLSQGISLLEALEIRYRGDSTKDEEDEMYVLSASNRRVSIQLVGKDKVKDKLSRFEELTSASLSYMGISSPGIPCHINTTVPNMKELDLTGNLLSEWKDAGAICEQLPLLGTLNLSNNFISPYASGLPLLKNIHVLVLNNTGVDWVQVQLLGQSLPALEELHLMGNNMSTILPMSSTVVQGFDSLRLLNLDNNCIAEWEEIMKLSQLRSLEQLYLNKNCLNCIHYPDHSGVEVTCPKPFQNLRCLLLGGNNIGDMASIDSLNFFPKLVDVRLSENLITDPARGGVSRFILIARLAKIQILNGSEISPRERKDSEIRYVRVVISRSLANPEEIKQHPRFSELKKFYGIEDERTSTGTSGPQTMASGFLSITLKCVGPSMGEKPQLTKKLPATTTVGKLKLLCESFFKLKSVKLKLYLQEEGSPLPLLLDNDMATFVDLGIGNESIIIVDEGS
ncbi:tubulin-folding cofactor E isoform X1 [Prosopis cineraria]|uniref:tubulin-folding cofactor E isoform X1 n=2 Tax=Prosopis cineraria TaxID=364024 RepID=UPI0024100F78|nr:tubulin-folding cofactor E isoform X1 [Prosopis cineraria]XP_054806443.1 tubulin-folding cofactor E isoform X1 [Prosopis cineraria]XP_054806444.1 tubulin-folding cofactor E isoform X1 [Prosopis cineraria]XP_054806445.1 tubulin-folding cofactor E isoform X1 [Prosopis cineraria]